MNFEEQNQTPSTPLRCGKASTSDYNVWTHTGNKFSPMQWPSPGPSFGGITSPRSFGIHRTPVHGFGAAAIGDGRLSMGQFEFGADGELVLYSAGGRVLPPSVDRLTRSPGEATRAGMTEALEISKNRLSLLHGELGGPEGNTQAKAKPVDETGGDAVRELPSNHPDGLTPLSLNGYGGTGQFGHNTTRLSTGGIVCGTDTMKQGAARQLSMTTAIVHGHDGRSGTLTDGGRCRYKSVTFGSDVSKLANPTAAVKAPMSPLEFPIDALADQEQTVRVRVADDDDMSNATPQMRTRKIQSLYDELETKREILSYLQNHIRLADQQIAKLIRTNVGLWACSAHIASCIGLALEEESAALKVESRKAEAAEARQGPSSKDHVENAENMVTVNNARQSKRRRSSLGVASLTQSLNPKANKRNKATAMGRPRADKHALMPSNVAMMAPIDGKQLLELEEIFARPSNCEFATGEMMNHLPLSSNVLKKKGMCPVENHDTLDSTLSPVALRNLKNALHDDDVVPDVGTYPREDVAGGCEPSLRLSLSKENSFSFHR